ncbi:unnamed protein product [Paramecium pentaurelia]|uniref:Uncharacterized protein n=1 Tax=Paramecium pentaurelia TaxID=43138 RepID=A0A8S1YPE9_9CILI|nr:unnamed protein product [Paramecium pentaurelia]
MFEIKWKGLLNQQIYLILCPLLRSIIYSLQQIDIQYESVQKYKYQQNYKFLLLIFFWLRMVKAFQVLSDLAWGIPPLNQMRREEIVRSTRNCPLIHKAGPIISLV